MENDNTSNKLLSNLKKTSSALHKEEKNHNIKAQKAFSASEKTTLIVRLIYGFMILALWLWSNNKICKPIALLSSKAKNIANKDNI